MEGTSRFGDLERFRKPSRFGKARERAPVSNEECKEILDKGIKGIEENTLSVRVLKDMTNAVADWFENNKSVFSTEIHKKLGNYLERAHDKFSGYKLSENVIWLEKAKYSQEAKGAIDEYLQFAKGMIEFKELKEHLQAATDYINKNKEAFQELGYNIKRFDKMRLEAVSLEEAISREPNNSEHIRPFIRIFNAIDKMTLYLSDFVTMDHEQEVRRDVERKKRIEEHLKELPRNYPRLENLSKMCWRFSIGAPMHEEAQQMDDPGLFLDHNRGSDYKGYKQSMEHTFEKVLVPAQYSRSMDMNYNDYNTIHNLVTEFLPENVKNRMQTMGGISEDRFTCYPIIMREQAQDNIFRAFQEIQKERINDRPLFQYWQSEKEHIEPIVDDIRKSPPEAIVVGWAGHSYESIISEPRNQMSYIAEPGHIMMIPSYRGDEGPDYVTSVLSSYYEGRERPDQTEYDRLREIARTIRTLFIMHPHADGNARTIRTLMNKNLIEEGFPPTILPSAKVLLPLDELVEEMVSGMRSFMKAVEQNREKPSF